MFTVSCASQQACEQSGFICSYSGVTVMLPSAAPDEYLPGRLGLQGPERLFTGPSVHLYAALSRVRPT